MCISDAEVFLDNVSLMARPVLADAFLPEHWQGNQKVILGFVDKCQGVRIRRHISDKLVGLIDARLTMQRVGNRFNEGSCPFFSFLSFFPEAGHCDQIARP